MPHVIERITAARAEGLDVAANVYPYAASSTSLSTLVPDWALEGGYSELKKRLADPVQRARIAEVLQAQFTKRGAKGDLHHADREPDIRAVRKAFRRRDRGDDERHARRGDDAALRRDEQFA